VLKIKSEEIGMKSAIVIAFVALTFSCWAQQEQRWLQDLESPRFESDRLQIGNELENYAHYDFSTLLVPRREFLGYIGDNYRRLRIFFNSVSRSPENKEVYLVKGVSLVGDNKCTFEGTIKLRQVRLFKKLHYGMDDVLKNAGVKAQGLLIGEYSFMEENSQSHSGLFSGISTTYWYVDKNDILHYDWIEWFSDRYRNNQFVGKWTEYKAKTSKICNWGESRIPFSGDLDIGAGEFSPNSKYAEMGWADYKPWK